MPDYTRIAQLCRAYARTTGVATFVNDHKGKVVSPDTGLYCPHNFCRVIQEKPEREEQCSHAHLYGSYQSERFGEAYIYFCPFGLVHWAAPVMENSRLTCALVAGPVLMSTPEDALIDEILFKNGLTTVEVRALHRELERIPYFPPPVVNDMAAVLFATASHLSSFRNPLDDRQEFYHQQASLSEVLQGIKGREKEKNYPLEKEKELINKIQLGDKAGAQEVLNEIFGYIFFTQGNEIEQIKTRVMELVVLLSRAALEGGADNELIFGLNYNYLREIGNLDNFYDIVHLLSKVMARFTDCVFNLAGVKNIDIIYKAVAYLRKHYMEEISLEKVAGVVNLSPSYFSKVFKEEMKCNFSAYLNMLRVENSKKYLLNEDISLVEVAGLAGFQDQSYFTKVFKKIVNTSPGEFRKSRGLRIQKERVE